MAYANSTLFYGWSEKDVDTLLEKITGENCAKLLTKSDKNVEIINKKLNDKKVSVTYAIFEGGLGSKEFTKYLYFGKVKTNQSCNSDDISEESFTIKELKDFMDFSFKLSKQFPGTPQPKLYNLTVADQK